jgi:hypothetical protein
MLKLSASQFFSANSKGLINFLPASLLKLTSQELEKVVEVGLVSEVCEEFELTKLINE